MRLRPLIMAARFCCLPRATQTSATDPSPFSTPTTTTTSPFPRLLLLLLPSPPLLPWGSDFSTCRRWRSIGRAEMAAVRVDKATNELLLGPDWTLNIDICDAVNSDHGYVVFSPSISFTICSSFGENLGGSVLNSLFPCHRNNGERFVFLAPYEPKGKSGLL